MKDFMRLNEYCNKTGMSRTLMLNAIHSSYGKKFAHKTSNSVNAPYIIDVGEFERLMDKGVFDGRLGENR